MTAACLEVKMRKVKVHKAYEVDAPISAEEASREDGVLTLLHGETQEQLKMRALLKLDLLGGGDAPFTDFLFQLWVDMKCLMYHYRIHLSNGTSAHLDVYCDNLS